MIEVSPTVVVLWTFLCLLIGAGGAVAYCSRWRTGLVDYEVVRGREIDDLCD